MVTSSVTSHGIAADESDSAAELSVCKKAIAWYRFKSLACKLSHVWQYLSCTFDIRIFDYVRMQIKRKSREHTREMHSVIVAAYHCLVMLLVSKPQLLRDKECLKVITQCVEIGISGSSSYPDQKQVGGGNERCAVAFQSRFGSIDFV
jgi:hypothetical protein